MKRFLIFTSVWLLAVVVFFLLLLYPIPADVFAEKKMVYLQQHANTKINLLVLGSSRAEHAIDPTMFGNEEQVFIIGENGHGMPSNYVLLKLLVQQFHVQIDTLLLQVDEFSFNGQQGFSSEFRDDVFYRYLNDKEVYDAYEKYRGKSFAFLFQFFPQAGDLIYNDFTKFIKNYPFVAKSYSPALSARFEKSINNFSVSKGYVPLYESYPVAKTNKTTDYILQPDDVLYFTKLVKLCKENNIALVLFRAPVLHCKEQNAAPFEQYINSFSVKENVPFFDYKCSFQYENCYYNNTHFTDTIARLLTADIISRLKTR